MCAGTARLTQAVRMVGLTTLDPVDKLDGWDLTSAKDVRKLKDLIVQFEVPSFEFQEL